MMSFSRPESALADRSDAHLVARTLEGDAMAFHAIVSRYQSLVCAVTFSATGNLQRSEELAQETFVAAWKQLKTLREPEKLRAWLCGIARLLGVNALRRDGREPVANAEPLEADAPFASPAASPAEGAIAADERAILWRTLEQMPANYRETMVLYYREGRSSAAVATALGISEDAVRQQLSRGRKMLQDRVLAVVERGLSGSGPTPAFTSGVMASVGPLIASAKLGSLGGSAGGAAAKVGAAGAGMAAAAAAGLAVGAAGAYLGFQIGLSQATSDEERRLVRALNRRLFFSLGAFFLLFFGIVRAARIFHFATSTVVGAILVLVAIYSVDSILRSVRYGVRIKAVRQAAPRTAVRRAYRSRAAFLGLPLVNVDPDATGPVWGWIVATNGKAIGGLFALGGVAVAPIAVGGFPIGILACGGIACGGLAFGGLTLGGAAVGGIAAGWRALGGCAFGRDVVGGCAFAWHTAMGGFAAAPYAVGGAAAGAHANDAAARALLSTHPHWLAFAAWLPTHMYLASLTWLVPLTAWALAVRFLNRRTPSQ